MIRSGSTSNLKLEYSNSKLETPARTERYVRAGETGNWLSSSSAATSVTATASSVTTATTTTSVVISSISPVISPIPSIAFSPIPSVAHFTLAAGKVWIEVSLSQYFTFTNPYFDPDLSIYSQSKYVCIIDIHPESMQRNPALLDLFGSRNFCSA